MDRPLNVLLIEDNPGDARLIQTILTATCGGKLSVHHVDRLATGLARVAGGGIDLLLLDLTLPDSEGADTFTRARAAAPQVPIVVLTGTNDEALATRAVKQGAQDYLVKDGLDGEVLSRSLRYAFERHRMMRKLKRLTLLEERARIARDIHDGAIQSLFGVGMILKDVASLLDDDEQADRIEGAAQELGKLSRELREFIFSLQPGRLSGAEIDEAIRELAEDVYARSGLSVKTDIEVQAAERLGAHASDLIQIAREALSNVVKHAEATSAVVSVKREKGTIVLRVEDDGRGFDPERSTGEGQGLRNMRERARAVSGTLVVSSRADGGSTIDIAIPI